MKLEKILKTDDAYGTTTITYAAQGTGNQLLVLTRRRRIEHGIPRRTTWGQPDYFVWAHGEKIMECKRLKEAQEYAEAWWTERSEK